MATSIPLSVQSPQFENPLNALARALQVQSMQQQSQQNRMTMEDAMRQREATNKLNMLYQQAVGEGGAVNEEQLIRGAAQQGLGSMIPGLQKNIAEQRKAAAEVGKVRIESAAKKAGLYRDALAGVSSPEQAAQWLAAQYQDPDMKGIFPMPIEQAVANIPRDPQGFQQWVQKQALGMGQFIEKNAPKTNYVDSGGQILATQTPGLGGVPTVVGQFQKTQTPESMAADRRAREEAARSNVTYDAERGILVDRSTGQARPAVDVRTGEQIGAKDKPLTDAQSKALLFGARMQESNAVLEQLASKGVNTSIPGSRAPLGVGPVITALSSAERQQLDQAKRDFINAVLRRESGAVIADSEFNNAEKQYFPQIGDSAEVIAQKKKNREIAMRGILEEVPQAQRGKIQQIRGGTNEQKMSLPSGFTFIGVE